MIEMASSERILTLVSDSVGVLIILSLLLALFAIRLRLRNEAKARRWAELEARWTPILFDVLAEEAAPADLHAQVGPNEERAFIGFLTEFSRRVRGKEWEIIRTLADPLLDSILPGLERRDPERRARTVHTLGELGMPRYEEVLVRALNDESPLVAMVAARRLFSPGNERHFSAVLERLGRFAFWSPRFLAGMLASGGSAAILPLREIASDPGRDPFERVAAVDALRVLNDSGSADLAARVISSSEDGNLRVAALRLLATLGHSGHAAEVRALLGDPEAPVKQAAAEALGAIGNEGDLPALVGLLDDESPWVRVGAARALVSLGARDELLLAAQSEGPEGAVAREVLES